MQRLRRELAKIEGMQASVIEFSFYNVGGEGGEKALAYSIRGPSLDELDRIGNRVIERLSAEPGFVDLDTNLDLEQPQLFVTVDRERAADLGLDAATIFETVYALDRRPRGRFLHRRGQTLRRPDQGPPDPGR